MPSDKEEKNITDYLYGLEKEGVSRTHLECLMWFHENENKIVNNDTLQGVKVGGVNENGNPHNARRPIPPNDIVRNHHYLHAGIRGWYKPKGKKIIDYDEQNREAIWEGEGEFVQSLQTGKSGSLEGYGEEIEYNEHHEWIKINYNHNPESNYYEITGGFIDRCYKLKLPIGIILKQESDKNMIMGLGFITNVSEDKLDYTIEPIWKVPHLLEPSLYFPGQVLEFHFVEKDFENPGSIQKSDARYRWNRFKELENNLQFYLSNNFENYQSFVGRWSIMNNVFPYTWLGLYDKNYGKMDGFQFQIYLTVDPVEKQPMISVALWLEGKRTGKKNRDKILHMLNQKKEETFRFLKNLPNDYNIIFKNDKKEIYEEWIISKFTESNLDTMIQNLEDKNSAISICKKFSPQECINPNVNIVREFTDIFDILYPLKKLVSPSNSVEFENLISLDEFADKILDGPPDIAVKKDVVLRILRHLEAGKNVILVGAPGVGKTMLSKRILEIYGREMTNKDYVESIATAEWSRYHVIGGTNLEKEWHNGVISKAAEEKKWLLIDEFNRADINKAFGEMFLAIEGRRITLTEEEQKRAGKKIITIPDEFRMIGTMNDYDKNLLLTELSYGLITRFAFIDIEPDQNKEKESVKNQIIGGGLEIEEEDWNLCNDEIQKFFEFTKEVREWRMIGVRTTVDVIRYMVYASKSIDDTNKEKLDYLDEALCDYLLPQFDRLDKKTIEETEKASKKMGDNLGFTKGLMQMRKDLEGMSSFLTQDDE